MTHPMRTRFAPSPTGFLHVGGLRTALFAYLVAKQSAGKFVLRIEDTDQERSVPGSIEQIIHGLTWAGMAPDEGVMIRDGKITQEGSYGPYIQSERLAEYQHAAKKLRDGGHAYPCFCTPGRLDEMRQQQQAAHLAPMYDRKCISLSHEEADKRIADGERHVLRMIVPRDRMITFTDDIRGDVSFAGSTIDDQVLLKSDGFPTYHLAHVVDDHAMQMDVIIRGEDWLPSTPKHVILFEMLGWPAPRYAHLSLILNKDRSKLSKRQGDVSVHDYIEKGYLPEALVNFLALLGWNPGTTDEIFTLQELIDQFSLERVQKAGAIFDTEKLDWVQGQWMRKIPSKEFAARILERVGERFPQAFGDEQFEQKAVLIQERILFFKEAPDMLAFFYEDPVVQSEIVLSPKQKVSADILPQVTDSLIQTLDRISDDDWNLERIRSDLLAAIDQSGLKKGQVLWPLRAILTGRDYSPGAFEVAAVLGKEVTLKRLKNFNL